MTWYYGPEGEDRYGGENRYGVRVVARSEAADLSQFGPLEVVLEPDKRDPRFRGCHVMDFYCPQVIRYPYAQDAYFLFNTRLLSYNDWYLPIDMSRSMRRTVPLRRGRRIGTYYPGVEDIELDASRDGIHWHRYDRKPWLSQGPDGAFDSRSMYMAHGMYHHGDEIWIYYVGLDDPHTNTKASYHTGTLSRVIVRKDGFTCVEADYEGGEFTTPSVVFAGNTLFLNIETSALGLARVELQDDTGHPIDGFSLEDCDRLFTANSTRRSVTWRHGSSNVSHLADRPIRLRFELRFGAKLYSFRFERA